MHGNQSWRGQAGCAAARLGRAAAPIALLVTILGQTSSHAQLADPRDQAATAVRLFAPKVSYAEKKKATKDATVPVVRVAQEKANWCWAACAQMIHAQNGRTYTQEALARYVHGEDEEWGPGGRAAAYRELLIALSPDFAPDLLGQVRQGMLARKNGERLEVDPLRVLMAQFAHHAVNSDDLVEALLARSPVLVVLDEGAEASLEHAYVVRSAGWVPSPASRVKELGGILPPGMRIPRRVERLLPEAEKVLSKHQLVWVELIDPDPAAVEDPPETLGDEPPPPPAFLRLSGKEFSDRVRLILTPKAAHEILEAQHEILRSKDARLSGGAR